MEKEFSKVSWLEELAEKYEVPVEQVMFVYAVIQSCENMPCFIDDCDGVNYVLNDVFK